MIIRPYQSGDLDSIESRESAQLVLSDWTWTIAKDGVPKAVFSLVHFWGAVGHIVGIVDDSVRGDGFAFSRAARQLFKFTVDSNAQYNRIHAFTFNDENSKWARLMGMTYECTMKKASPDGHDARIYVYLR